MGHVVSCVSIFFFKQKTAYELLISDWSSDVCSSDLDDLAELQLKIDSLKMSKEAKAKAQAELKKLRAMAPMSAEATVVRNYLDTLIGLPWGKKSKLKKDIAKAQEVLDDDH